METLALRYVGRNVFGDKLYQNSGGIFFVEDQFGEVYLLGTQPDNDPLVNVRSLVKYKDARIVTTGDEEVPAEEDRLKYMMLGRLQSDVKYYLGYGRRNAKYLWALDERDHIDKMKEFYEELPEDKKPEWLTWEEILAYEKEMIE